MADTGSPQSNKPFPNPANSSDPAELTDAARMFATGRTTTTKSTKRATDDYTARPWTLPEILSGTVIDGLRFFDFRGHYELSREHGHS
ncbi:hypothetical protein [Streptomyces sp. NPDC018036]|uniref:hypothetical protein n=1 Tax=Streptomyces sp. NPDC018036 TaxID=3365035 RepID=UPI003788BA78